jgi:hypothetical protein
MNSKPCPSVQFYRLAEEILHLCGTAEIQGLETVKRTRGGAVECVAKIFPNLLKKVLDKDDLLWYLSKY